MQILAVKNQQKLVFLIVNQETFVCCNKKSVLTKKMRIAYYDIISVLIFLKLELQRVRYSNVRITISKIW